MLILRHNAFSSLKECLLILISVTVKKNSTKIYGTSAIKKVRKTRLVLNQSSLTYPNHLGSENR